MDFLDLKNKASRFTTKAKQATKTAVEFSAGKLAESWITLGSVKELDEFIEKSSTTVWKDAISGEEKKFKHSVIVIFADTQGEFFTQMLYKLPVLATKAFSQNVSLKLADISMKWLDAIKYGTKDGEALVLIENKNVVKIVKGTQNIQKIVKEASLDINKSIQEL